ncbi:type II toxin-antitoxin system antitoxin SocA domain-containing protein [Methylobacterium sp. ARG-1]|uniref:Panacea domain-containing protein n=1 Tax=Methylobacterium sp. ARG-1 TaxID=1692501 RepID=UPI000A61D860|nr:type II toxin-antitoxin system antitoxin SocA domain-containing protein [Methylobacterium sp. ARG-1]
MQILKLVYIAHGWRLGLYGKPLIKDEVQAWQYGPVIPRLYNAMRHFRSSPVVGPLSAPSSDTLNKNEKSIVEQVYNIYGDMSGPALSRLTHAPGTPWDMTYEDGEFGVEIPNDIIEDHYERLAFFDDHPRQVRP